MLSATETSGDRQRCSFLVITQHLHTTVRKVDNFHARIAKVESHGWCVATVDRCVRPTRSLQRNFTTIKTVFSALLVRELDSVVQEKQVFAKALSLIPV